MGLLPCPLPCHNSHNSSDSHHSDHHLRHFESLSSSSSLSSQSSLPSVPSLNPQAPLSSPPRQPSPAAHHLCLATLKGHSSYVSFLALAGKSLLSASSDGEIRFWNRHPADDSDIGGNNNNNNNNNNLAVVTGSAVKSVVVLGDRLITAHQDHKIRVWKADDGRDPSAHQVYRFVTALPTLTDRLTRIFSAKNYVEVRRHKKCTWVHHVDAVSALALSSDHSLLYSVSWDRTLKVWRTSDFKCLESINKAHEDAINAVVVSSGPDGLLCTGSADTKIKVWARRRDGEKAHMVHSLVATLEKHKSAVNALALSGDGRILYSGACDRSILVWEREGDDTGTEGEPRVNMVVVGALRGHAKSILCLTVVSDLVISGSADKTIRVWRREAGTSYSCLVALAGHTRPVKCIAAAAATSGDDEGSSGSCYEVYSGGLDCSVKVWQVWVPRI
ncbi:protein JINGUBANG [Punica granatum]|uniref:Uncharacterized protein n=2 Tax=Punica granatum TaxID=22663 RepID=A0A218WU40_PUNGR|nr:protein JINGUBANG [Punica granatum]OWM76019.1 hypothetical protein CDL15_Pgr009664 [Punica granatum]PKI56209.1 hypothetical protein CRG98_023404 [Punica granatum]